MLKLSKGRPAATAIPLPYAGAVIFIRPATAFEVDIAAANAARVLAGLVEGEGAAALALDVLGDEFRRADFTTRGWIDAAAQRVALLELATLCSESWAGIVDGDGKPVQTPTRDYLALLLRDGECARRVAAAIHAKVHDEVAEGNASAASLNGAAGAAEATAPSAAGMAVPAPTGGEAPAASAAPK